MHAIIVVPFRSHGHGQRIGVSVYASSLVTILATRDEGLYGRSAAAMWVRSFEKSSSRV